MRIISAEAGSKSAYLLMVRRFHAEGQFPFALDMVRQSAIFDLAMTDSKFALWLAYDGTALAGFFLAGANTAPLSGESVAQELMMWVDPAHRGSRAFAGLHGAFLDWGDRLGVDRLSLSLQASMRPEATGRLYRRLGYNHAETHYTKRRNA